MKRTKAAHAAQSKRIKDVAHAISNLVCTGIDERMLTQEELCGGLQRYMYDQRTDPIMPPGRAEHDALQGIEDALRTVVVPLCRIVDREQQDL
jgi:hypothetical protein